MGNGLRSLILLNTLAVVLFLSSLSLHTSLIYSLSADNSNVTVSNETGSLNARVSSVPDINSSLVKNILDAVNNTDTKNITIEHVLDTVNNTDTKNITIQQILDTVNNTDTKNITMQNMLDSLNKTATSSGSSNSSLNEK